MLLIYSSKSVLEREQELHNSQCASFCKSPTETLENFCYVHLNIFVKRHFPCLKHSIVVHHNDIQHTPTLFCIQKNILFFKQSLQPCFTLYTQTYTQAHTQHQNIKSDLRYNEQAGNFMSFSSPLQELS